MGKRIEENPTPISSRIFAWGIVLMFLGAIVAAGFIWPEFGFFALILGLFCIASFAILAIFLAVIILISRPSEKDKGEMNEPKAEKNRPDP